LILIQGIGPIAGAETTWSIDQRDDAGANDYVGRHF
jgi:hypothetical protein